MRKRIGTWLFRAVVGLLVVFLSLPLLIVVATAFDASGAVVFPPEQFSVRWFGALLERPTWIRSVLNSLFIAGGTTVVSMIVGVAAALGVRRFSGAGRTAVVGLTVLPLFVPGIVIGIVLLTFFSRFGLQQSYLAIIVAHSLWATPLTFSVVQASFARFDWHVAEAARDLGATPRRAFLTVVAPNVRAGLLVAALVAFVVSLQEFIMTLFLSGPDTRTVPVQAWNSLRQGLDPLVSVVSTILIVAVTVLILAASALVGLDRLATDT
ncbi:ABC transporter permease [Halorientalis regularis]|jgi:ABC-type spermidine/putrescine transport system permease subunit II|uniref:Spermidine/putrescine transport system permease protein n=1 Tax=Halorientalis regularis TaxID=660518 RepID=A0A1G7GGC0_9EURY|nr:ABC transporter permease [Halorientalis regularis]SDE87059.1 spermidine/putrescine transport system permease protein [Halorientalis regularis]